MRKVISFLLALTMVLSLCACGSKDNSKNQEAADAVSALIDAIGTVKFSSSQAISDAQAAYDSLTPEQQKLVANHSVLLDAANTWSEKYHVEGNKYSCTSWSICDNDVNDITYTDSLYVALMDSSRNTTIEIDDSRDKLILSNSYGTYFAKMAGEDSSGKWSNYDISWDEAPIVVENKQTTYTGVSVNYATGEVNVYYVLDWEEGKSIHDSAIGENAYNVFEEYMISVG